MFSASTNGNKALASLLIRSGAHIDTRDKDNKTALMIAVINGHEGMVAELLNRNADLSAQNEVGDPRARARWQQFYTV